MNIYKYTKYRSFLKDLLQTFPKRGYGQLLRLSQFLNVNSAYVSQVFKETKSLTVEQALATSQFFNLGQKETEYFLLMVQWDRAGTQKLRDFFSQKIKLEQEKNLAVKNRVAIDKHLDQSIQSVFYSDWVYSAVRQTTAIKGHSQVESIAGFLGLHPELVLQTLEFLVESGLCVVTEKGYALGPQRTHLDDKSIFIKNHHQNWRLKSIEKIKDPWKHKLHYSCPMTIAKKDAPLIRELILEAIEKVNELAKTSSSEELVCFNVDWFNLSEIKK